MLRTLHLRKCRLKRAVRRECHRFLPIHKKFAKIEKNRRFDNILQVGVKNYL